VAVYLDVSGSMNSELTAVAALLHRFERYLRRPFHAFGTTVERAEFRSGRLVTKSTGGTSMACVLAHLKKHRPEKALVITDGFVERLPAAAYAQTDTQVEILLTANGTAEVLEPSGWSIHRPPERG
jgi:predicted metal-dependent peptidase